MNNDLTCVTFLVKEQYNSHRRK